MIRLFLFLSLLYSSTNQAFKIELWGVPAAEVTLNITDIDYNNQTAKSIIFQTNSISFSKYIFNIDNYYETITSSDIKTILSFNKKTSQPKVVNNIQTHIKNNKVYYNNSSVIIPSNHYNIFSLLYFISINKILTPITINIEREGIYYYGTINPIDIYENNTIKYELILKENYIPINTPIIEDTDIFTWALFKKKSTNYIIVDYNTNQILKCIFKSGLIKMHAKNIN